MSDQALRALERRSFRAANDDGLWDVLIASVTATFAIAPLLSGRLGDFWSSAVFVPFWAVAYVLVRVVRTRAVAPRIGTISPGPARALLLRKVGLAMVVVYTASLVAGIGVAVGVATDRIDPTGLTYPVAFGIAILLGFSLGGYVMGVPRFVVYGFMLAAAPLVGEWLWRRGLAAHHGYPAAFGAASAIILIAGIVKCTSLIRTHALPPESVAA